jgi:hypothetical protein
VRALTALSRATRSWRIASTMPSQRAERIGARARNRFLNVRALIDYGNVIRSVLPARASAL